MKVYKLCFYVPLEDCEAVKQAVFSAGAGVIGEYDSCAWQIEGRGQFRPSASANPSIGQADELEFVEEYKVEMICKADRIEEAIEALKQAHPYEEPAFEAWKLDYPC